MSYDRANISPCGKFQRRSFPPQHLIDIRNKKYIHKELSLFKLQPPILRSTRLCIKNSRRIVLCRKSTMLFYNDGFLLSQLFPIVCFLHDFFISMCWRHLCIQKYFWKAYHSEEVCGVFFISLQGIFFTNLFLFFSKHNSL